MPKPLVENDVVLTALRAQREEVRASFKAAKQAHDTAQEQMNSWQRTMMLHAETLVELNRLLGEEVSSQDTDGVTIQTLDPILDATPVDE